jgi:superfamily II DNA or RNA helicase
VKPITTEGFELVGWQRTAVEAWERGDGRPFTGTLEVFTGGGKTLLAVTAIEAVSRSVQDLRVAVVVPSEALARQWIVSLQKYTNLEAREIGLLGAGGHADFTGSRAVVAVLNSAAKLLPGLAERAQPLMLVVDECHRAGAPSFSNVLDTKAPYRLGLSATPEREELDESGEPLAYDEQLVGRSLGGVVSRFSLKDARAVGWLPDYEIHHHGVTLHPDEQLEYETVSRRVDDLADQLRQMGIDSSRAHSLQGQRGDTGDAVRAYIAATSRRKDLLYRVRERTRIAARLVTDALAVRERRVLLFHERVDQAVELHDALQAAFPDTLIALEHSRLPQSDRTAALAAFRSGRAPVLVSVKSLIEGIDVPEADLGVSVASSASVRQRIQALGRVLRRSFDETDGRKEAQMHVIYVSDTVDELIYAREDWGDLTGEAENHYWVWPLDPDAPPERRPGPPATPRPSEDQEWARFGGVVPAQPSKWLGAFAGQEYSVDTLGTVRNEWDTLIGNAQGVDHMVAAVRGRPGGRFRVTPLHRLVLVAREGTDGTEIMLAGQLNEPFRSHEETDLGDSGPVDASSLAPGAVYPGPAGREHGAFHLRMKRGGTIERKTKGGAEFALTSGSEAADLEANAERVLRAWKDTLKRGITFYVNELDHAWYEAGGERLFLAEVPGGFAWPED